MSNIHTTFLRGLAQNEMTVILLHTVSNAKVIRTFSFSLLHQVREAGEEYRLSEEGITTQHEARRE